MMLSPRPVNSGVGRLFKLVTMKFLFVMGSYILLIFMLIKFVNWLSKRIKREAKRRAERRAQQEERDRLTLEIAEEVEQRSISEILSGGDIRPFALYLRPFSLEERVSEYRLFHERMNFDYGLQRWFSFLGMMLISIGAPNDDKEGAGHVLTADALWFERFRQLAECAKIIVIVPGIQPGIMNEIRWLREWCLLEKAIFFKPKGYPKAEWRKMQKLYEQGKDIDFPDYSPKELSFRVDSSGKCQNVMTWSTVYRKSQKQRGNAQWIALLSNKHIDLN